MAKSPKQDKAEVDPRGGDAILKRMLQTKPKTHDEMVEERHASRQRKAKPKSKKAIKP